MIRVRLIADPNKTGTVIGQNHHTWNVHWDGQPYATALVDSRFVPDLFDITDKGSVECLKS